MSCQSSETTQVPLNDSGLQDTFIEKETGNKDNASENKSHELIHIFKKNDREKIVLNTTVSDYSFITDENSLSLTVTGESFVDIPPYVLQETSDINDIQLGEQVNIMTNHSVIWKVYTEQNQLHIEASSLGLKGKRIVIDPGHGGENTGTYGRVSGIIEKELTLIVSKLLKEELEREGAVVTMTRTEDTAVYQGDVTDPDLPLDLIERANISHLNEADAFLSIHADNFPQDLSVNGTAVFYHSEWPHSFQGEELATLIGTGISKALDTKWNGIKDQPFVVLRENKFPSVLIEMGFLSNKNDEAKLIDPANQKRMVQEIAHALKIYFKDK
jgi:N-acetylmuramoyl-L-alanine amidase